MKIDMYATNIEQGIGQALVADILFDGESQHLAVMADEEGGCIERYEDGFIGTKFEYGKVEIVWKNRADESLPWWLLNDLKVERAGFGPYKIVEGRLIAVVSPENEVDVGAVA